MASGMFLETIRSPGLSHLSYIIGHQGRAAVVDPRRDCNIYVEMANRRRSRIAATILKSKGYQNVENCLGSMAACSAIGCPVIEGEQ